MPWVWRSLRSNPLALASAAWLTLVALGILAEALGAFDGASRLDLSARNLPPFDLSRPINLWLGADSLGRPILGRLCEAAGVSLAIALSSAAISVVFGTILGLVAGYARGPIDAVIMRAADVVMGFPTLLVALIALYLFGQSILNLVLVLAITRMPAYIRVTRAETLELRERLFVDAARVIGAGHIWILRVHVLPLVMPTVLTLASINAATVMLFESGLSYLGLGIQPPLTSWGLMVAQGQSYLGSAWWLALWPGLAIMLSTMAFNFLASWYRVAGDPSRRWRSYAS